MTASDIVDIAVVLNRTADIGRNVRGEISLWRTTLKGEETSERIRNIDTARYSEKVYTGSDNTRRKL